MKFKVSDSQFPRSFNTVRLRLHRHTTESNGNHHGEHKQNERNEKMVQELKKETIFQKAKNERKWIFSSSFVTYFDVEAFELLNTKPNLRTSRTFFSGHEKYLQLFTFRS